MWLAFLLYDPAQLQNSKVIETSGDSVMCTATTNNMLHSVLHCPTPTKGELSEERLEESCNTSFCFHDRNKGVFPMHTFCAMYMCMCIYICYVTVYTILEGQQSYSRPVHWVTSIFTSRPVCDIWLFAAKGVVVH